MNIDFAFITCEQYKDLILDDRLLFNVLEEKGYRCQACVWDDPGVDWQSVRVSILRSAWDYDLKFAAFLNWIDLVSSQTVLVNPPELLHWNINKRYLEQISNNGLATIPTRYLDVQKKAGIALLMAETGWTDIIVKPAIGLSARGIMRINNTQSSLVEGQKHIDNLLKNIDVLVQPYFTSVENYGERNLIFIDGKYSHCVRKMRFQAAGKADDALIEADSPELGLAQEIVNSISPQPFYARVDLIRDLGNQPCLIELELIDPKLFFELYPKAVENCVNGLIRILQNSLA